MKKIIAYSLLFVGLLIAAAYYFWGGSSALGNYEYITISRSNVVQEVSVTGKVKAVSDASLSFNATGRIAKFNVSVGSVVKEGEILASLENADLVSSLEASLANVKAAQARLSELKRGTRPEELKISEASVSSAELSFVEAKKNLIDKVKDSYTKSDDSIRNKIDRMFINPRSSDPKISFVMSDAELKSKIEFQRFVIESKLLSWSQSLLNINIDGDLNKFSNEANANLNEIKDFLDKLSFAVNGLTATSELSQTTIDTYKSETATARSNVNLSLSNLVVSNEKLTTASSSLNVAINELNLKKSGTALEQITVQEAQVEQAVANANNIRAQIAKTILRSPINGIVTKKDFEVGEIVSSNSPVISVISNNEFEMEANIPEADIAKVKIGDKAKVTLDAYGSDVVFGASVTMIEPAETMIEGVATYKTIFNFDQKDERIRSGMTANIDILTNKKEGVIVVPQRSVRVKDLEKIVLVDTGKDSPEERKIETGLRGSDGFFEVISGLSEGERVVSIID